MLERKFPIRRKEYGRSDKLFFNNRKIVKGFIIKNKVNHFYKKIEQSFCDHMCPKKLRTPFKLAGAGNFQSLIFLLDHPQYI